MGNLKKKVEDFISNNKNILDYKKTVNTFEQDLGTKIGDNTKRFFYEFQKEGKIRKNH